MKLIVILSVLICCSLSVAVAAEESEPAKIGNFILPGSRQPGPLIAFGENILEKNETQVFLLTNYLNGKDKQMVDQVPSLLYGIRDDFSVFFNLPIAVSFDENQHHSSGLEDSFVQFEYAYYLKTTSTHADQATIVGAAYIPTGSSSANPPTGFGSPSFFEGVTFNRTFTYWMLFTSYGALLTTEKDNTQFGNQYLYQAGFERNLFDIDNSWIFACVVEADGQYTEKDRFNGVIDNNSGGNTVFITPSLWISSEKFIFQLGAGLPVVQHLFGSQDRSNYLLSLNLGWVFN